MATKPVNTDPVCVGAPSVAGAKSFFRNLVDYYNQKTDSQAMAGANNDITSLTGLTTPLSVAQGGMGANTAAAGLENLLSPTANKHIIANAAGTAWEAAIPYKVGNFSRDLSTASSQQIISGVGFKASTVQFFASVNNTFCNTDGVQGPGGAFCKTYYGNNQMAANTSLPILVYVTATDTQSAYISDFSDDGFTIAWIKVGLPTGFVNVFYIAER